MSTDTITGHPFDLWDLADVLKQANAVLSDHHGRQLIEVRKLENDYRYGWQTRGKIARRKLHAVAVLVEQLDAWAEVMTP